MKDNYSTIKRMLITIKNLYTLFDKHYGHDQWWQSDNPYEVFVGSILTQNTNWNNVIKSMQNLKADNKLNPESIMEIDIDDLEALIKPSGFYKQKAIYLKAVTDWYLNIYPIIKESDLRSSILKVKGVGPETADTILLYALNHPVFVIDAYTMRIVRRLGYTEKNYRQYQTLFTNSVIKETIIYQKYHAYFVEHAKRYCKKTPLCEQCFLNKHCQKEGEKK